MPKCKDCGIDFIPPTKCIDVLSDMGIQWVPTTCLQCEASKVPEYVPRSGPGDEMSTCFKCPDNNTCKFAWDDYNLDGDCLLSK